MSALMAAVTGRRTESACSDGCTFEAFGCPAGRAIDWVVYRGIWYA
jgi:hypothetical protein